MKCSLGISDFLEEISNISHSVVFLYFFASIAEEDFLISSCYSLELCIQMLISFLFSFAFCFSSPLLFASLLFTAICRASPDSHFAFLHSFSMGMVLIPVSCTMSWTSFHSSSDKSQVTMKYHLTPVRMDVLLSKRQVIISIGENVEEREHLCIVGGNLNWYNHYGKQYRVSSKN